MKKGITALSCVALAMLTACNSDSKTDEEILASGGYVLEYVLDGQPYKVRSETSGVFEIECPRNVVCDGTYVARAHVFHDDNIRMYLSFAPDLVGNYSYSTLLEHFNYGSLVVPVPMLNSTNSEVYFQSLEVLRELGYDAGIMGTTSFRLDLHDFTNGYLSGTWQGNIIELTERTEDLTDDECYTGDIMGECYERIPVTMPFTLQFNIEVEQ